MQEQADNIPGLWIHQESAIISAESHDIWSFTPEFLLSNKIVSEEWDCTRATRDQNTVDIQFGPVNWRMTENNLWITSFPDCPLEEEVEAGLNSLIPVMARSFLVSVPYLPSRRFWYFWQISVVTDSPLQWMLDNFSPQGWPSEFEVAGLGTDLTLFKDDQVIQINIRNQSRRRNQVSLDSISFDCYASCGSDLIADDMIEEPERRSTWLQTVEQILDFLLKGGNVH